jgi:hypothetical protein
MQQLIANTWAIVQALTPAAATPGASGPTGATGATLSDVYNVLLAILKVQQNATAIQTFNVQVTTPNQQVQFTSLTIPDGFPLSVIASPNNSGNILIAPKNGNLQQNIVTLKPGQGVQYKVTTSDALYIVGTVVGDFVILTSEVKP